MIGEIVKGSNHLLFVDIVDFFFFSMFVDFGISLIVAKPFEAESHSLRICASCLFTWETKELSCRLDRTVSVIRFLF